MADIAEEVIVAACCSLVLAAGLGAATILNKRTRTATRSCRTRKRAFHFYSPGVVRRSHAATRHVRPTDAAELRILH